MRRYRDHSDKDLIILLKQGDEIAFAEIYDRYWSAMYAQVYKMLRNTEDSKDLLQDMFSAMWLNAWELKEETKLSGYLYISAKNRVFNLIKRNKVRNDYLSSVIEFFTEQEMATLEALEEKDMMAAVEAEIQQLPPKMREIFELSRKGNLTHKEIAEKLNISDQTVRKQVQNALRILRPKLHAIEVGISVLLFMR